MHHDDVADAHLDARHADLAQRSIDTDERTIVGIKQYDGCFDRDVATCHTPFLSGRCSA